MYRAVFLVLLLCFPGAALAQNRPLSVDVDRIEDVRLNEEGRRILRFRTNRVGRLRADIFANPDSTGAISVTFRERGNDDTDSDTPPSDVWGAGRYEAVVQAVNPGSAIIQMRVTLDVPLDEYEPNNSLETAARVDLPFRGMVQLNQGDMDWFRVDPEPGGVLGIQLTERYEGVGPQISVYRANGELIYQTQPDAWDWRGMRYVETNGQPLYVQVADNQQFSEGDANIFKRLEMVQYRPEGDPASSRSLVTLSIDDENSARQLDLIGRAIGVETVAADEAESIARELDAAIRGRGTNWTLWIGLLVLIIALGAGGIVFWRSRKQS